MPIKKEFNLNFFEKWSQDMSYILGFIYADGNIIKTKRNTHFLSIYTADKELLESIVEIIKSNHKISERKSESGVVYVIQIGSKNLYYKLVSLGLTNNKSCRMKLPIIPKKYQKDFIRGYFDGDGNVWKGYKNKNRAKPSFSISCAFTSSSKVFLDNLFNLLKAYNLQGGSLFRIKDKNCYRLQYSTLDTLKLYKVMYNRECNLFLSRKRVVFEDYINMRS